jgi:signal transduction histidine kinase
MTQWQVDKMYDKFYKGNSNKEGFGIWLFLVKRVLDLYKWKIQVVSERQKGTKVIIEFV